MGFNKFQQEAIDAKLGQNVLISAGAGSGKTKTLSEKVFKLVKEDHVDPSSLLVLTFTNKAAFEMKDRIIKLFRKMESDPERYGDRMVSSHIQTFDSFSLYLVKKYSSRLNLPDNISVMDEALLETKRLEFLDEVIHELYENDFERITSSFRKYNMKGDSASKKIILYVDDELNKMLLEKKRDFMDNYDNTYLSYEFFVKEWKHFIDEKKKEMLDQMRMLYFIYCTSDQDPQNWDKFIPISLEWDFDEKTVFTHPAMQKIYAVLLDLYKADDLSFLDKVSLYMEDEELKVAMDGRKNSRNIKNNAPKESKIYIPIRDIFKSLAGLVNFYGTDLEDQYQKLVSCKSDIHLIFEIIDKMNAKLNQYKKTVNAYTFGEVGSMALSLLQNPQYQDIAEEIKNRFTYVLVDEYQDTNDVQETFLNQISEKATLFCVGDAKQSIYAFRNSNVGLFLQRRELYQKDSSKGRVINMNWNYRSDRRVLDDINAIFVHYMTKDHGNISFLEPEEMLDSDPSFKRIADPNGKYGTYWIRFRVTEYRKKNTDMEAKAILTDIQRKIQSGYPVLAEDPITHEMVHRPCRYSDFAILIRKKRSFQDYEKLFREANIPFNDEVEDHLGQVNAIMTLQSLIRLIADDMRILKEKRSDENRLHLFLSIARSYLYGNKMRDDGQDYDDEAIYETIRDHRMDDDPIMVQAMDFAKSHVDSPLSLIFTDLLNDFHVIERLPSVGEISSNLSKIESFYQIILSQEQQGQNIFDFVNVLKNISKYDVQLSSNTISERENAVKLMTIHKSKGLEFPIIYLPFTDNCLSKGSNLSKPLATFSKDYGILLPDYQLEQKSRNLFYETYKNNEGSGQVDIDEQVRINYVALTRAKEAIYFVGSENTKSSKDESLYDMLLSMPHYPEIHPEIIRSYSLSDTKEYQDYLVLLEKFRWIEDYQKRKKEQFRKNVSLRMLLKETCRFLLSEMDGKIDKMRKDILKDLIKTKFAAEDVDFIARVYGKKYYAGEGIENLEQLKNQMNSGLDPEDEIDEKKLRSLLLAYKSLLVTAQEKDNKIQDSDLLALYNAYHSEQVTYFVNTHFDSPNLKMESFAEGEYEDTFKDKTGITLSLPKLNPLSEVKDIDFKERKQKERASMQSKFNEDEDLSIKKNQDYGTYLHRLMELVDFKTKDTSFIHSAKERALIDNVLKMSIFANTDSQEVYKEYSYIDSEYGSEGIIDCFLVSPDHVDIIDYKTNDIDKPEYVKQLSFYARNVALLFPGKSISCYLLSLVKGIVKKVDVETETDKNPSSKHSS